MEPAYDRQRQEGQPVSLQTTLAQADARIAEDKVKGHRLNCARCRPRKPCETAAELKVRATLARTEARRQKELDGQPAPGQGELDIGM
jgi:hypothetical protein